MVDIHLLLLFGKYKKMTWASLVLSVLIAIFFFKCRPLTKEPNRNFSCLSGRARKCFSACRESPRSRSQSLFYIKYWVTSSVVDCRSQSPGFPVKKLGLTDICKRTTWRTFPRKHVKYVAKTFTKDKPVAVKNPHYLELLPWIYQIR